MSSVSRRVLVAPDKFKATATAAEVVSALVAGARSSGWSCQELPMADGGEGVLEVLPGPWRWATTTGPLGAEVTASWKMSGGHAFIEMAQASGLALVGGAAGNKPTEASSYGTGQLIDIAIRAGATKVSVALGGSATTDGGLGALEALAPIARLSRVELVALVDVNTTFLDAAIIFGPQKGATEVEVRLLTRRLEQVALRYEQEFGCDVRNLVGSGAAGGLAGGLAAVGAELVSGSKYVARHLGLDHHIAAADLVVTGEGRFDRQSLEGKVCGEVIRQANQLGVPVAVVAGQVDADFAPPGVKVVDLSRRFGLDQAMGNPKDCLVQAMEELLADDDWIFHADSELR